MLLHHSREVSMKLEGGCYCGNVRYAIDGDPVMKAQCHCRECQYITGGAPNMFMLLRNNALGYTRARPSSSCARTLRAR